MIIMRFIRNALLHSGVLNVAAAGTYCNRCAFSSIQES